MIVISCIVLFSYSVIAVALYVNNKNQHEKQAFSRIVQQQKTIKSYFNTKVRDELLTSLHILASNPALDEYMMSFSSQMEIKARSVEKLFRRFLSYSPEYCSIFFVDFNAITQISVFQKEHFHKKGNEQLAKLINKLEKGHVGTVVTTELYAGDDGEICFIGGVYVQDKDIGEFGGAVMIEYSLQHFISYVRSLHLYDENVHWILSSDGRIIDGPGVNEPFRNNEFPASEDGVESYSSHLAITPGSELADVCIRIPSGLPMRGFYAFLKVFFIIILFSYSVSIAVIFLFSRRISQPIEKLAVAARELGQGNLTYRTGIKSRDEIGLLSNAFNQMAESLDKTTISRDKLEKEVVQRREAEELLQDAFDSLNSTQTQLRGLFNNMSSGAAVYSAVDDGDNFIFEDFNNAGEKIEQVRREDLIGKKITDVFPGVAEIGLLDVLKQVYQTGKPEYVAPFFYKDDRITGWRENYIYKLPTGHVVAVYDDVTERHLAAENLKNERERLAVTLESIGDGVIATDTEGVIQLMNKVAEELTGWNSIDAIGRDFRDVMKLSNKETGEYTQISLKMLKDKKGPHGLKKDTVLISKSGVQRYLSNSTAPIRDKGGVVLGYVLAFRDITRRREMENEIQKGQKLEAIGLLAGGIAHDFNNLLTGVIGNLSLIKMEMDNSNEDLLQMVEDADHAAAKAKNLTQQLLTFAKGGTPVKKSSNIDELVTESATFILRGSNVKCNFIIPEDIWPVEVDRGQIDQVINNLVINAKQAMNGAGAIDIFLENLSQSLKTEGIPLDTGKYVKLSIADQGTGITKENLQKIFDPYFTTKADGNGLGLATTFSIIRKHGGYITVDSEVEKGTVFHIYLPASEKEVEITKEYIKENFQGEGRILLMDDDEIVRDVTGKMLDFTGYQVLYANDGEEALEIYRTALKNNEKIDVVIMDLTIPGGMGGKEAIKELLLIDPNAQVVVGSGYSNDPVMSSFRKYGFKACVAKPYDIGELSGTISGLVKPKTEIAS